MGVIVEYAYTRDAVVTPDNVERLLPAADQVHYYYTSTHINLMQKNHNQPHSRDNQFGSIHLSICMHVGILSCFNWLTFDINPRNDH